jgi:hypothetical protein
MRGEFTHMWAESNKAFAQFGWYNFPNAAGSSVPAADV